MLVDKALERKLKRAESLGAITLEEAAAFRESARGIDWIMILELISVIAELIREWLENRE